MNKFAPYAKAVLAAIVAGLSALSAYLVNNTGFGDITAGQWIQVALAFVIALAAVFAVPNASK